MFFVARVRAFALFYFMLTGCAAHVAFGIYSRLWFFSFHCFTPVEMPIRRPCESQRTTLPLLLLIHLILKQNFYVYKDYK